MYTRLIAKFLSFLGFMIGFTSEVLAQYGVPVYFFTVKGSVKDIECQNPVKNAQVKLIDRKGNTQYDAVTDSLGHFTFIHESEGYFPEYNVKIEDSDGKANGLFTSVESSLDLKKWRATGDNNPDTIAGDIYFVKYVSGAPCKAKHPVVDPDSDLEKEPDPEVILLDSMFLPQNNTILLQNSTNEQFTNVNLFLNPDSDQFIVEFTSKNQTQTDVCIFSSNETLIYSYSHIAQKGANHFNFAIQGLASGTYLLKLSCVQADFSKIFIVQ